MKKTDKEYWFKRRRYGYGWTPVRWQGWVAVAGTLIVITVAAIIFGNAPYSNEGLWFYLNTVLLAVVLLLILAAKYGPKPKWRWGKKPGDNSKEDF
jgi:hypothetical protein